MGLPALPNELLLIIASHTREADLNALAQTNKRLYEVLDTELYRHNITDSDSHALLWSSLHGHFENIRKQLRLGANPNTNAHIRPPKCLPPTIRFEHEHEHPSTRILTHHLWHEILHSRFKKISLPLIYASATGHASIVELLIEHGAEVQRHDVYSSEEAREQDFFDFGPDVRYCHRQPLIAAADQGHVAAIEILAKHGADVNGLTACTTPLRFAATRGHVNAVRTLLRLGADVNDSRGGFTALMGAARGGQLAVVEILLDAGADVSYPSHRQSDEWEDALTIAAQEGHVQVAELLLDRGADIEVRNEFRRTPLGVAAENGRVECVEMLLNRGADIASRDRQGFTPLREAALFGSSAVVEILLKRGAQANVSGDEWDKQASLLAVAIAEKKYDEAVLLLEHGADPDFAVDAEPDPSIVYTPVPSPIWMAVKESQERLVMLLLRKGADPNVVESNTTPLYFAMKYGDFVLFKLLLMHGADVLGDENHIAKALKRGASSPFDRAQYEIERELYEQGLDPYEYGFEGLLSPTRIMQQGDLEFLKVVLEKGGAQSAGQTIHPDDRRFGEKTALFVAVVKAEYSMAKVLLENGANASHVENGRPLIWWARKCPEMVDLLVEHGACRTDLERAFDGEDEHAEVDLEEEGLLDGLGL